MPGCDLGSIVVPPCRFRKYWFGKALETHLSAGSGKYLQGKLWKRIWVRGLESPVLGAVTCWDLGNVQILPFDFLGTVSTPITSQVGLFHGPPRTATRGREPAQGRKPARGGACPTRPTGPASLDKQGRPMIITRSSQKLVTLPTNDAYNEEGKEEKEDKDKEEEPVCPVKRQQTSSSTPKGKGKGKAKANTPAPSTGLSRFPPVEHKTWGKHKKNELPSYVPPRPVPTMDMVRLVAESLAKEQSESTVFDAGCSNYVFRNRECDHGVPGALCDHCNKGRLSHCSHNFTISDHTRASNHLKPLKRCTSYMTRNS
ncbi:hypothetical protein DFH08DRAFT_828295 [Mycena albidolilacea]|uniref:Uncharacterized protein n=1 Tax=Mycena albidolilacea TaxID=1033008 RepID=A0AAD6YWK9_9AGAR|nr:hypothetical protein DFH08DRAFT_828295 [Mycena albidolilacea]